MRGETVDDLIPIEQAITMIHDKVVDLNLTTMDELLKPTSTLLNMENLNTETLITNPTPMLDQRLNPSVSYNCVKVVNLISPLQPVFNRNHINRFRRLLQQKKP